MRSPGLHGGQRTPRLTTCAVLASGETTTEYAVQQVITAVFEANRMDYEHPAIVSVNANAADPHYAPSPDRHATIGRRHGAHRPVGAETKTPHDCFADITWVAYCGEEPPATARGLRRRCRRARSAVKFIQERMAAGHTVHGYEVDDACRAVIAAAGCGPNFIHRTGHSLGVKGHYNGVNIDNLETQDRRSLIPHVMFTIEPGVYLSTCDFDGSGRNLGAGHPQRDQLPGDRERHRGDDAAAADGDCRAM